MITQKNRNVVKKRQEKRMDNTIIPHNILIEKLSNRLELRTIEGTQIASIVDNNPPIYIIPFVLDQVVKNTIKYIYLHEYNDPFKNELKTSSLAISGINFDSKTDAVLSFVSQYFSIPKDKIDLDRVFYLGEMDINLSIFSSKSTCFAINLSGFLRDNEVEMPLDTSNDNKLVRVSYNDILKGHYLDAMTMSTVFQTISYFML